MRSEENLADIGTRYGTSANDANFLTSEAVAPHSTFANGRYWFPDLNEAENSGIITSARKLKEEMGHIKRNIDKDEICLMSKTNITNLSTNPDNSSYLLCKKNMMMTSTMMWIEQYRKTCGRSTI